MLRSVKSLKGMPIQALDGPIGSVSDFYFDDQLWTIRYLVVDTGHWLSDRKVLILPAAIGALPGGTRVFPVLLTKKQIEESPETHVDLPVYRQREISLAQHSGWTSSWAGQVAVVGAPSGAYLPLKTASESDIKRGKPDPHLRSANEVIGYHIQARDGAVGHVEDFVIDDEVWAIRHMVVDTRNWLPGKKVLIAPAWVSRVRWSDRRVRVDLICDVIKGSPEYNQ